MLGRAAPARSPNTQRLAIGALQRPFATQDRFGSRAGMKSTRSIRLLTPRKLAKLLRCQDFPPRAKNGPEQTQQGPYTETAHSITSSARASSDGGNSRPSALAVFRLMRNSNLVGCSTASSPGLAPFSILST